MNASTIKSSGVFLANIVDDLFTESFDFKINDPKLKKIMSYFIWVENTLYLTFFEEPEFVVKFEQTVAGIKIYTVSHTMALVWGMIMKREIK